MLSVTVKITGNKEELAKLKKLGDKLHDFRSAMGHIGKEVTNYYGGQGFASQGGVYGARWAKLSPVYARRKSRRYPGRGILVASGTMQKSFTARSTATSVSITNTQPYFKYHQSSEPRTKMPYRPIMAINDDVKSIVKQLIKTDIDQKLRAL